MDLRQPIERNDSVSIYNLESSLQSLLQTKKINVLNMFKHMGPRQPSVSATTCNLFAQLDHSSIRNTLLIRVDLFINIISRFKYFLMDFNSLL